MILRGLREVEGVEELVDIFDITEFTYTGKDMGERAITATIYHPSPIDFRAGDYAEFQIQSLERATGGMDGSIITEKFYIYTMPTIKKTARPMTHGQAFEHTLTLYPAQYELALVQMRDLGNRTNPDSIIYTGFDSVTFYGGAFELMERIMMVLDEAYGKGTWSYKLSNEVNEEENDALEKFLFTFSGNTVMDALLKLNDKEGINTTFFINDRTIYVGFKRPYFCRVLDNGSIDTDIDTQMFNMRYGKTSHESIAINYGCLFDITKSVGKETPITKLFAYGAERNLNRFYCSDRIKTGRYVNRLMLPSFDADGKTDFILSEKGIEKFGIREGSKQFEDIYPSLRYVNYGDIRQIQYCIKLKVSGLDGETKDNASFPIARVQCYKVVPSTINVGVNALVECAPPDDIAVYIHTIDSVVKVVLYGGSTDAEAIAKQRAHDTIVPTRTKGGTDYIPGSCFAVHDRGFDDAGTTYENENRSAWFTNPNDLETSTLTDKQKAEIQNNQVTYANTPFITDLYRFVDYNQTYFSRDGYSAWGWARLNSNYVSEGGIIAHDSLLVNEVVAVEPVVIPDTDLNIDGPAPRQQTFDVYLRDLGFKLNEQNDFGEMVFVLNGEVKVSFIDGILAGREFSVNGKVTEFQENCICAFNDDASINDEFFEPSGYTDPYIAEKAFADGAIWRLRLIRSNLDEPNLSNLAIALPTPELNAKQGDHVVLLDLFMPDIYVHAAENRLLREAQQYLDANDNGSISYAVNFDEVRMQQIPNYALQIREGLQIRMEDADLAITTENDVKKIFDGKLVSNTSLYKTTYEEEIVDKYYYTTEHRDYYDIERGGIIRYRTLGGKQYIDNPSVIYFKRDGSGEGMFSGDGSWSGILYALEGMIQSDYDNPNFELFADNGKVTVRLLKREVTANGTGYSLTDNYAQFSVSNIKKSTSGGAHGFTANCYKGAMSSFIGNTYISDSSKPDGQFEVYCIVEYDIKEKHTYEGSQFTPNTHLLGWGSQIYCPSKILTEFRAKKHYAIEMELYNTELFVLDTKGYPIFALINNLGDDAMIYQPICEKMDMLIGSTSITFKFEFDTIEGFNDSQDYYPAILYKSDNKTEYIKTELLSITESDYEGNGDLPYADFVLDSVTIQVSDNSQREVGSAPVKTISATLSEQQDASAWATLMNKVDEAVIEGEANAAAVENLVNSARKNYLSILSLKDSIFDPDGTCDQTFLQVMMMQIGADSMNYRMLKTNVDMNGVSHNCRLFVDGTISKFEAGSDTLYHYVYTQGAQGGTWEITPLSEIALDGTSVYYIALKCQREGMNGEWICETTQHKVDEDATHWYFNWGILTVDSAGVYTLIETRGNAYMYGDNLICGKISDLAKKSWFDLTRGEFVLGDKGDGTAALKYVNGVLTIGGIPSQSDIDNILTRLGLVENIEVGGRNLLRNTETMQSWTPYGYSESTVSSTTTTLKGKGAARVTGIGGNDQYKVIYSLIEHTDDRFDTTRPYALSFNFKAFNYTQCVRVKLKPNQSDESAWSEVIKVAPNEEKRITFIGYLTANAHLQLWMGAEDWNSDTNSSYNADFAINEMKLEYGTIATDWTPAPEDVDAKISALDYLKEALVQDTDIVGGIVATSQIHLRDWTGKWVDANGVEYDTGGTGRTKQYVYNAGLSGMLDDGVLMWGGGDYLKATQQAQGLLSEIDKLPILLTKSGESSKIGCINVVNSTQVEITGSDNTKIVIDGGSQNASIQLVKNGTTYVKLTTDSIKSSDVSQKALTSYIFEGEPIFVIHSASTGAINKTIYTLSLPADTYDVDYTDCSYIRVDFGLHLNNNGPYVTSVKIKFDIYLGSYLIGRCNATMSSLQTSGVYTSHATFIPKSMTTTRITGGSYGLTIKNAVVTCVYGGETKNMNCRITSVSFGKGNSTSTWEDGDITFSSVAQPMVTIGQNGLQVVSSSGLIQIMNTKGKAYMKMQGLPTDDNISTLDTGQLYIHEINFDDFKEKLATFVGEAYAAVIKDSFDDNKEAMNNALPNPKCIAVKE
jgi:hypothetical protein